jgi:hypothetical protein
MLNPRLGGLKGQHRSAGTSAYKTQTCWGLFFVGYHGQLWSYSVRGRNFVPNVAHQR